jgi:hypothetical protein
MKDITNIADLVIPGSSNVFILYLNEINDKYSSITVEDIDYTIRTPTSFKINNLKPGWKVVARLTYGKNNEFRKLSFIENIQ